MGLSVATAPNRKLSVALAPGIYLIGAAGLSRACRLFHSGSVPRVEIGLDLAPIIPQVSPLNSLLREHWRVTRGLLGLYTQLL